jgi:hypothetical protein
MLGLMLLCSFYELRKLVHTFALCVLSSASQPVAIWSAGWDVRACKQESPFKMNIIRIASNCKKYTFLEKEKPFFHYAIYKMTNGARDAVG